MPGNLYLDVGNTRIKWRWVLPDQILSGVQECLVEAPSLDSLCLDVLNPQKVWVSCVAGEYLCQEISRLFKKRWGLTAQFALSGKSWGNLINGYTIPESLGVDRWLALVAASDICSGDCVVVDAGTVISCDLLLNSGLYSGGMLIPGLQILAGVFENRVPHLGVIENFDAEFPGTSTKQAIALGVSMSTLGSINYFVTRASEMMDKQPRILITGGDAQWVSKKLEFQSTCFENLVLDGLELYGRSVA